MYIYRSNQTQVGNVATGFIGLIAVILNGSVAAARMLVLAARRHVMKRMGRHLEP